MFLIVLMLLIPILCVGLVAYINCVYNILIDGNINNYILVGSMIINIIMSYVIPFFLFRALPADAYTLNRKNSGINNLLFIYILLLVMGVSLIINSLIYDANVLEFIIGSVFTIFIVIVYFISKHKKAVKTYTLVKIKKDEKYKYIYCLEFMDSNTTIRRYYVDKKDKYKENTDYICSYNVKSGNILRIKKEKEV